jgi:antitoxin component YwqK of YwqJK toxin-antitoxin module
VTIETPFSSLRHDDHGSMFLDGKLFTGTAVDAWPDGRRASKVAFVDGVQHGPSRLWHPNGTLAEETPYVRGCAEGLNREWYPTGQLKLEELIGDDGFVERRDEWDETGALVRSYKRA